MTCGRPLIIIDIILHSPFYGSAVNVTDEPSSAWVLPPDTAHVDEIIVTE